MTQPPNQTEYVYLLAGEGSSLVKIGRSIDVPGRLADIQRMSPTKLSLLWQTEGGAELEAELHRRFKDRRSHGEWFDFPDRDALRQVLQVIAEISSEEQQRSLSLRATEEELQAVEEIVNPIERIREVGRLLRHQRLIASQLAAIRRRAVAEARRGGMSLKDVADDLGVSPGRVSQLANDFPSRRPSQPQT